MNVGEVRRAIAGLGDDAPVCLRVDGLAAAIAESFETFLWGMLPNAEARLVSVEGRDGTLRVRVAVETTADCDGLADTVDDLADTVVDDR